MGIEAALAAIEKQYGQGALVKMSDKPPVGIDAISTGSLALDAALGIGGLPRGRVVEIYGPESSGKSTVALHVVAEAQKAGGICAYIDAENALDPIYAAAIGVNVDDLYVCQPDSGEEALDIAIDLASCGDLAVIVIDSVAALIPRAEIEGEMGDAHMGLQARLMGQALRKLNSPLARSNTLCIFINQLRDKIGVAWGSPETTTGGKSLKFYASVRLDIRRIETLKTDGGATGNRTRVKVIKNKVAIPHKQAEFDIMYGEGISKMGSLIDEGVKSGVISKSGAWLNWGGIRLGQGKEKAKVFLEDNPEAADQILTEVRALI